MPRPTHLQSIQQRHVDLQRLWRRLTPEPQAFVGSPISGAAAGQCPLALLRPAGGGGSISFGPAGTPWSGADNITASDGTPASCLLPEPGPTGILRSHSHGFEIPTEAVIQGIVVRVLKRCGTTPPYNPVVDDAIWLTKDGTAIAATGGEESSVWPNTYRMSFYGSFTDLWLSTWTPEEINAATFGAAIRAVAVNSGGGEALAEIDSIEIAVCYRV